MDKYEKHKSKEDETGQSEWQFLLDFLVKTNAGKENIKTIKKLSNIEKIQMCYNDKFVNDTLKEYLEERAVTDLFNKSNDISRDYRTRGNRIFSSQNPFGATEYYTKAILYALPKSEELALAYGNRSAVLFLKLDLEECVADIDRAFDLNFSNDARNIKLYIRKGKALLVCNRQIDALVALRKARKLLYSTKEIENNKKKQLQKEIEILLSTKFFHKKIHDESSQQELNFQEDKKSFKSNPTFIGASEALLLKKSKKKGRYVVAEQDLSLGDILFIETPFAFVILPDPLHAYCQNCAVQVCNPIPCDHCAEGSYCSETCKTIAWKCYHHLECRIGLDVCYNIGIAHLGLRVAIVGLTCEDKEKYTTVQNLVHHLDSMKPADVYMYSLTATLLVMYLENYTALYKNHPERKEMLFNFGSTILVHIAQLICNGHAIVDFVETRENQASQVITIDQKRIGTGIYPSTSMMNHSCDPNINASFFKSTIVVKATKNIPKGTEVFNCYGPNFRHMKTEERKEVLQGQYSFNCNCEPCTTSSEFLNKFSDLKCASCGGSIIGGVCVSCKRLYKNLDLEVEGVECLYEKGKFYMSLGVYEDALKALFECALLTGLMHNKYNKSLMKCKDLMAQINIQIGNYNESYLLTEECLAGIKERFGEMSTEYANELLKLASIMRLILDKVVDFHANNREMLNTCIERSKKALEIFKLFYGTFNDKCSYLTETITIFESYN